VKNMLTHSKQHTPRRRHWWRWIAASIVALVIVIVAAVAAFVKLQPASAPLTLPRTAATAPVGPLDGTWYVTTGSVAGFRVQESALGLTNYTGGRTSAVTGVIVVTRGTLASATIHVGLTTIKVDGKTQPQFATSLDTRSHRTATVSTTRPVILSRAFASGATISATATAQLTMNGVTRTVSIAFSARRDGAALQAAGSIPVTFAAWRITGPAGFGPLASLASRGQAEFLLILRRR
jgi:polyisoprenoid-binding protein YceI